MTLGTLYTFGYSGMRGSPDLRDLLQGTLVETVIDVRLSVWSGNRAFSTATRHTVEDAGLVYVHDKDLGNLAYKTGGIEIKNIEAIEYVLDRLRAGDSVALMCVCPTPRGCHRWTLASAALDREPDLKVVHLSRDGSPIRHVRLVEEVSPISLGI